MAGCGWFSFFVLTLVVVGWLVVAAVVFCRPLLAAHAPHSHKTKQQQKTANKDRAAARVGLSATMFDRGVGADVIPVDNLLYQPDDGQDLVPVLDAGGARFTYGVSALCVCLRVRISSAAPASHLPTKPTAQHPPPQKKP